MPSAARRVTVIAPGRVNLIGEHTDYNDGLVLPLAIEPHIRLDVTGRTDRWLVLATDRPGEPEVRIDLDHLPGTSDCRGSWTAYPCGVVAGLQRLGWDLPGCSVRLSATLPVGAGLSSSAALAVGLATAFERLVGRTLPGVEKPMLCQRAEHEYAGVPCGIMDPFAVTFARAGHALLLDCRTHALRQVPLAAEAVAVLVIHSGVRHSLADGAYARRRTECHSAARRLGVPALRDLSPEAWHARADSLPDVERRRARHVVTEHARTLAFVAALERRDWPSAGLCLAGSHASLRDDFEVSCPELDLIVELGQDIAGVFGCRMTGGGFGGSAVALVDAGQADRIRAEFRGRYRDRTGIDPLVFATRAAGGVGSMSPETDPADPARA